MADSPIPPRPAAVNWIYSFQGSGRSLATFLGDVYIEGNVTFSGSFNPVNLALTGNLSVQGSTTLGPGPLGVSGPSSFTGPSNFPIHNEWVDPQFCIQDSTPLISAADDPADGGTVPAIAVTSYTTGSRNVTCYTTNTQFLLVGSLVAFEGAPADPALRATPLVITGITPNVSFTFTLEYASGVPTTSAACSMNVVQHGNPPGASNGQITSNLTNFGSPAYPTIWISDRPAHTQFFNGCARVLVWMKGSANAEAMSWNAPASMAPTFGGQQHAVGMAVVCLTPGASAQCVIDDGAFNPAGPIATANTRTWISTQKQIVPNPSQIGIGLALNGPTGAMFLIGEFTRCQSAQPLADGAFSTPHHQKITFLASVSPWNGTSFTTPNPFDQSHGMVVNMRQASSGAINTGTTLLHGLWEGQTQTLNAAISFSNNLGAPSLYGPVLHQLNVGADGNPEFYAFTGGTFILADDTTQVAGGTPSIAWDHMDFDLHGATLWAGV